MPKFDVIITRDATESVRISVEASNRMEAKISALKKACLYGDGVEGWELDDGNPHDVYITDVTETEAEPEQCDACQCYLTYKDIDGGRCLSCNSMILPK